MHAQISFENLAAASNSFQPCADGNAATVVSSQIRQRLFAFEDRGQPDSARLWSISGDIGAISAMRQTHFERASGVALSLRPKQSETLQTRMDQSFRATVIQLRVHSANSRAQYVMMMSAPARLSEVMISRTAPRSSTMPFSAAALIIAYSP